ncbi:unnamed protein product [Didymodactylos carnosus]|uniref:Trafficking protein particle complex subunit n=1 Tax=Didymodactylos carnosus TaxID=1234261 RepID=A0A814LX60_9BILA|nr:unnamed protein product [Didymodactylos carnosus]CAF1170888.1 unnamed protein product [Didymodactylos carnosus]CAF3838108.1 unnamed protein product [Didymodactylos carnosus]CAF3982235.1 unnamed protein product [Didymodactylos carnosus]
MSQNSGYYYYFVIVGHADNVLYETELSNQSRGGDGQTAVVASRDDTRHLNQFIAHSALDMVDEFMWKNTSTYLKQVDKFNEWSVSAYVTAGGLRFLILYEQLKNDEALRLFFQEIYETYVKLLLNPFYVPDTQIKSVPFDKKVQAIGLRHLL